MYKRKKIFLVLANVDKSIAFEWIATFLDKEKFELHFILLNQKKPKLALWCDEHQIKYTLIQHQGRMRMIKSLITLIKIFLTQRPSIVHTHLLEANLLGLLAAKITNVKIRIHTRHHSTFHYEYHPHAVKYDKMINYLSSKIVAISDVVKNTLTEKENVDEKKIVMISHGFDLKKFQKKSKENNNLYEVYNIEKISYPVIGVISRHIKWKGIQYIIPAVSKLKKKYPTLKLVLANSTGSDTAYIQSLLDQYLEKKDYLKIIFEADLFSLYQLFDVFVHVPINAEIEAFGQTYVEALASGIPSVFTLSGIANEIIIDRENALVVNYEDSDEIEKAIIRIIEDNKLRTKLKLNGPKSVNEFDLPIFIRKLEELYA